MEMLPTFKTRHIRSNVQWESNDERDRMKDYMCVRWCVHGCVCVCVWWRQNETTVHATVLRIMLWRIRTWIRIYASANINNKHKRMHALTLTHALTHRKRANETEEKCRRKRAAAAANMLMSGISYSVRHVWCDLIRCRAVCSEKHNVRLIHIYKSLCTKIKNNPIFIFKVIFHRLFYFVWSLLFSHFRYSALYLTVNFVFVWVWPLYFY